MISSNVRKAGVQASSARATRRLTISMLVLLAVGSYGLPGARAQQGPVLKGDYAGALDRHPVTLHISVASNGALHGTFDSPTQGKKGLTCTDFRVDGGTLTFSVPLARASWKGSIQNAGATLSGTWTTQGQPTPLTFTR